MNNSNTYCVKAIITDVDNTLFDWVDVWYQSFNAMLVEIQKISQVPLDILIRDIRIVHQRHKTSEYAFLIEEIDSIRSLNIKGDVLEHFDSAIHAFRKARKGALKLYETVPETLQLLKDHGVLTIAYTESMAYYTNYRFRKMGLDNLIDYLYSPPDHDLPQNLTPEQIRRYPNQVYELEHTKHFHTPRGALKPNPAVLAKIISDHGLSSAECIYIGDSLLKDIPMAQEVGVPDFLAEYGLAQRRPEYNLLRAVTHWDESDVTREREIVDGAKLHPITATHTLKNNFAEILLYLKN